MVDRGELICGINGTYPHFSLADGNGGYEGFDVDFCKVVAAAVLGDAEAVTYVPLVAAERFIALQTGEVDVLMRNTSRTATRQGVEGAEFPFITFHDGQGLLVRADSGVRTVADLAGSSICVLDGTTTQLNIQAALTDRSIDAELMAFDTFDEIVSVYENGQCEAMTTDVSLLAARRREALAVPEDHIILADRFSTEPLGPVVLTGDDQWATAVEWAVMVTVQAWEVGIDSTNIDTYEGENLTARVITGELDFDPGLGLRPGYPRLVISQVGNYREIYEANFADSGLTLNGSENDLVANGGILRADPLR